eukprot:173873-Rhodomonas_salina.4
MGCISGTMSCISGTNCTETHLILPCATCIPDDMSCLSSTRSMSYLDNASWYEHTQLQYRTSHSSRLGA